MNNSFSFNKRVIYQTIEDAVSVLDKLQYAIEKYGIATVRDLYEASAITANFESYGYGWTNLDNVEIVRIEEKRVSGFIIDLPSAKLLCDLKVGVKDPAKVKPLDIADIVGNDITFVYRGTETKVKSVEFTEDTITIKLEKK